MLSCCARPRGSLRCCQRGEKSARLDEKGRVDEVFSWLMVSGSELFFRAQVRSGVYDDGECESGDTIHEEQFIYRRHVPTPPRRPPRCPSPPQFHLSFIAEQYCLAVGHRNFQWLDLGAMRWICGIVPMIECLRRGSGAHVPCALPCVSCRYCLAPHFLTCLLSAEEAGRKVSRDRASGQVVVRREAGCTATGVRGRRTPKL
jgi:hypothetical protein